VLFYKGLIQSDRNMRRNIMRTAFAVALLVATVTPTLAQEFFIVQDARSKRCQIVDVRPSGPDMVVVGPTGQMYATRDEASRAMETVEICRAR
jgi:hypothetical protein